MIHEYLLAGAGLFFVLVVVMVTLIGTITIFRAVKWFWMTGYPDQNFKRSHLARNYGVQKKV